MRKIILYISLILILVCLPAKTWGQYIKKETTSNVADAVVLYSDGVFPGAVWELGRSLYDNNTGSTIRHTVNAGNGSNINVNSKLPFRILIAPTDVTGSLSWSAAMGFTDESNSNLNATADKSQSGCAAYVPNRDGLTGYPGLKTKWRLPTQRELQLMWLLRDAIDQAFLPRYSMRDKLEGVYWSSTEGDATSAWYFTFGVPLWSATSEKIVTRKVRCVRDY